MSDDDVPIRVYIDHIQRELQTEIDRRLLAIQEQTEHTAAELKMRLDGMNEFRGAMGDITATKVSTETFAAHVQGMDLRTKLMEDRLARIETAAEVELRKREDERAQQASEQSSVQQKVVILGVVLGFLTIAVNVVIAVVVHVH